MFDEQDLTEQKLKEEVASIKPNKSPGCDSIHVNVIKVFPIYKSGKKYVLSNYRLISVLPCFSKILEIIIYNRLYNYLNDNEILNDK